MLIEIKSDRESYRWADKKRVRRIYRLRAIQQLSMPPFLWKFSRFGLFLALTCHFLVLQKVGLCVTGNWHFSNLSDGSRTTVKRTKIEDRSAQESDRDRPHNLIDNKLSLYQFKFKHCYKRQRALAVLPSLDPTLAILLFLQKQDIGWLITCWWQTSKNSSNSQQRFCNILQTIDTLLPSTDKLDFICKFCNVCIHKIRITFQFQKCS